MTILKNLILMAVIAVTGIVTWLHTSKDALAAVSAYFHWTPEGKALFDVVAVPIMAFAVAFNVVVDTKAIARGWLVWLSSAVGSKAVMPSPKDLVDAAAKQAIAAGVSKAHVADLRQQNAEEVATRISQLNPPEVNPLPLDSLKVKE